MRLLCLSNGHGEDTIAVRVLHALQQEGFSQIEALPIVGEGHAYTKLNIPVIGAVKAMPSGGFIYMDSRQLARDIQGGLVQLTWAQIKAVQTWARGGDGFILAVGDIVPLLFAWLSGAPFAFVATAKSEYYLCDETGWLPRKSWWDDRLERSTNCIFQPWERWLMRRPQCKAVFPRDRITADILKRFDVPAFDLGNPMMDGLEWNPEGEINQSALTIALIPGSRPPEAYHNWEIMLQSLDRLREQLEKPLRFLATIAAGLDSERLHQILVSYRWQKSKENIYTIGFSDKKATLELSPKFAECLHRSQVAIAMAGTATEQFVGLGKPAIIIPGNGPQFTPAFAEAQTRLLGASVTLVEQPTQVAKAMQSLLNDPDRLQTIAENGHRRMGDPGAAHRIATCLLKEMNLSRS